MTEADPLPTSYTWIGEDGIRTFDAREMVGSADNVRIMLDGKAYWMRITRTGKLILTK